MRLGHGEQALRAWQNVPLPSGDQWQQLGAAIAQQHSAITDTAKRLAPQIARQQQVLATSLKSVFDALASRMTMFEPTTAVFARVDINHWPHYIALNTLKDNDLEGIDDYLRICCGVKTVTPDMYHSIWDILMGYRWAKADSPTGYIRTAFWRQVNKMAAGGVYLLGRTNIDSMDDLNIHQTIIEPGYAEIEDRLMIEWALRRLDPREQEALLRHCFGDITLLEAYGSKNLADAGRRRLRKAGAGVRPHLFI